MPNIKDKSTVEAIARAFCGECKRNKERTLALIGYKPAYYKSGRAVQVVYGNKRVKAAIARIDAKTTARSEYNIDKCDDQYSDIISLAIQLNQPSAAVSAITGRARLRGWDKDAGVKDTAPEPISVQQAEEYRLMAQAGIADGLKGPKLSKETA